ncbi:unnamed protein product, partial [Pelagomonas calceolata]
LRKPLKPPPVDARINCGGRGRERDARDEQARNELAEHGVVEVRQRRAAAQRHREALVAHAHRGHRARNCKSADDALAQLWIVVAPHRVAEHESEERARDRDLVDVELELGDVVRMREELRRRSRDRRGETTNNRGFGGLDALRELVDVDAPLCVVVVVGRRVAPPCLVAASRRSLQAARRASERESELAHFYSLICAVCEDTLLSLFCSAARLCCAATLWQWQPIDGCTAARHGTHAAFRLQAAEANASNITRKPILEAVSVVFCHL